MAIRLENECWRITSESGRQEVFFRNNTGGIAHVARTVEDLLNRLEKLNNENAEMHEDFITIADLLNYISELEDKLHDAYWKNKQTRGRING